MLHSRQVFSRRPGAVGANSAVAAEGLPAFSRLGGAARKVALVVLALLLVVGTTCMPTRSAEAASNGVLVIAIDPGHGGDDPGACANGLREADVNWDIANACVNELNTYYGVKAVLTQGKGQCLELRQRVDAAVSQGADAVISIHCNSAGSSAYGSEVWIPNSSSYRYTEAHVAGEGLANRILANLQGIGLHKRGVYERNCTTSETYPSPGGPADYFSIPYYARYAGIPGIIVEHAFLTNSDDAAKLADSNWRTKMGIADATGIAEYYGLSKVSGGSDVSASTMNKVGEDVVTPMAYENDPSIMGTSQTTVEQMVAWYKSKNKAYPSSVYTQYGAATIEDFCRITFEEANAEGVRAEVVFAQSMKETGWLQFGGQVKNWQCNFAGIGATDGGAGGADFSGYGANGVRTGLRAQVQHLKAYASTAGLNQTCVDPRFSLVSRGVAPTVKGLAGKWATATDYGDGLTKLINELLNRSSSQVVDVQLGLADAPASLTGSSTATVYVDGVAQQMTVSGGKGTVRLSGSGAHSVVYYEQNAGASDAHSAYPEHMYTWVVTAQNGSYHAKRYYGFDDLLRYEGSSIRVSGTKGIRMLTGVANTAKSMLTGSGVAGFTLVETGTLLAWNDKVSGGSLTFDTPGVSRGKAYVKGSQNPVFAKAGGEEFYTNVLVGFSTADQYKRDLAMRSYAVLADSSGNQVVVYGGTVVRSIQYIAQQNADSFAQGTTGYSFVHSIINACKG